MPYLFNRYYPVRDLLFFAGEGCVIFSSMLASFALFGPLQLVEVPAVCLEQSLLVMVVFQTCLYFFDMYDLGRTQDFAYSLTRIAQAAGFCCIILAALYSAVPAVLIHARIFWSGYIFACGILLLYRFVYYMALRRKVFADKVVVIGTGKLASDIVREIEAHYETAHHVVAFVGAGNPEYNPFKRPVVPSLERLKEVVNPESVNCIVVAPDDRRGRTPVRELLDFKLRGARVEAGAVFYERMAGKILVERIDPSFLIFSTGFTLTRFQAACKRVLDVLLAGTLFLLTLPVCLVSAVIIKLESPGPIFYVQERLGYRALPFRVFKFRSMRQDAEKNGAVWATENDPRVTRFGAFIRKVRIDELPQLWNVLKGEMSMVGPRPERQVFVNELVKDIPYYNVRHVVKPGVTGWAQVLYPYGASKEDSLRKLEFDLYYIKNISVALDLLVVFYTIKTVLFGRGR